ncbi:MAG: hypothetical protein OEX76_03255 [Candidatus Bathyarchaeota archaeon]|nr:hypothetical protein [Candidatus Bathyarchaeota archaeon]MDH5532472.1 hypothetical protein [Candidatus Bathyarchaeota archaeon]MDH5713552.1 hypothetical protein [Candidatus Bathyarchaeota archaeon]
MMQRRNSLPPFASPFPRAHVLYFSGKGNICINWAKDEPHRTRVDESYGIVDSRRLVCGVSTIRKMKIADKKEGRLTRKTTEKNVMKDLEGLLGLKLHYVRLTVDERKYKTNV